MKWLSMVAGPPLALLAIVSAVAQTPNEESKAVMIPLDKIWAYGMPGTHSMSTSMRGNPPAYEFKEGRLLSEIRGSLRYLPANKEAGRGFVVIGEEMDALREAHAVLVEDKKPRVSFPAHREVTLVFFSHTFGQYVHLNSIEKRGSEIEVRYRFVPHLTSNVSQHFALIPLGALPSGKWTVDVTQLPMDKTFVDREFPPVGPEWDRRVLCQSFSFTVADKVSETRDAEDAK